MPIINEEWKPDVLDILLNHPETTMPRIFSFEEARALLKEYQKKTLDERWDEFLGAYFLQKCEGCPEGHSSFWRTIIQSKEWKKWRKVQSDRMSLLAKHRNILEKDCGIYDMDEVEELGIMSEKHWQAFMAFLEDQRYKTLCIGVSQWREIGEKYKYWDYFKKEIIKELKIIKPPTPKSGK